MLGLVRLGSPDLSASLSRSGRSEISPKGSRREVWTVVEMRNAERRKMGFIKKASSPLFLLLPTSAFS